MSDRPAPSSPSAIGSALLLVGDQWNLLILQQAFLRHVRRFADWRDALGLADSVLTNRLRELVAGGVLEPSVYRTTGRSRTEYLLTAKGLELWDFLVAIWSWERQWVGVAVAATELEHLSCGQSTAPELGCRSCGKAPVTARDTAVVTGPDTTFRNVAVARHHRRTVRVREQSVGAYLPETLEILGDRWSTVVLVAAFLRVRRFADFQNELGIAPGVLSERLNRFVELGVFTQRPGEYRLTAKGLAFFPVFAFLVDWGQRWYPHPADGGLIITHRTCGSALHPFLRCSVCGQAMARADLRFQIDEA